MAWDTIAAARASGAVRHVVVVTRDVEAGGVLTTAGAQIIADTPVDTLNAALRLGADAARKTWRDHGIAALPADLPALRPPELASALAIASGNDNAFVPDALGTGTTLFTARPFVPFSPGYGPQSGDVHRRAGAVEVRFLAESGIRRDVDTLDDLWVAQTLGVGAHTAAVIQQIEEFDNDPQSSQLCASVDLLDQRIEPLLGHDESGPAKRLLVDLE